MSQIREGSVGKESACNVGDLGSIPGLGRSSVEGKGYPLQYSGLEKSMDGMVHGVTKSQTLLSAFHSLPLRKTDMIQSRVKVDLGLFSDRSPCTCKYA